MNKPTDTNWLTKNSWIMPISTIVTTITMVAIVVVYFSQLTVMGDQLDVMQGTLQIMEESQRLAQKPLLKMRLHKDPKKFATTGYIETDEGGERWLLYYYLLNIGKNPAYGVRYWHDVSVDSTIQTPDTSEFESSFANDLFFPDVVVPCDSDELLRQEWTDRDKKGITTYRHFIISYRDEYKNHYMYHAVWRIVYEQGKPLNFVQVSYEPVEPE